MADEALRDLLAEACRILAAEGHEHFDLGHASVRSSDGDRFWVKPAGLRLAEVTKGDLVLVDLDGRRLAGDAPLHGELPIHAEIYRRRPDVRSVVHTHPFHVAAFAAAGAELQMVSQDSVLFIGGIARFDNPALIRTPELGRAVAAALGRRKAIVLRNHGLAVAGGSIEEAVVLAVSVERSVAIQLAAAQLGGVAAMSQAEAADLARSLEGTGPERTNRLYRALRSTYAEHSRGAPRAGRGRCGRGGG